MSAAGPIAARRVRVAAIGEPAVGIKTFDLAPADGRPLPPFTAGAHIDVHVPNGPVRQYSLCSDPHESGVYRIAVKREPDSRGGSATLHDAVEVGAIMGISAPRNHFPVAADAPRHVFIAGGVGVTPILAMIREVARRGDAWELHYCARSAAHAAFHEELKAAHPSQVFEYFGETPLLDAGALIAGLREGEHVYCCGPHGLMAAVRDAARDWPEERLHFEWFRNDQAEAGPNHAFEVVLNRSGEVVPVPADRSILDVLRERGAPVESNCREGVCGACETAVISGEPDHRDALLTPAERAAGKTMMICVSRAKGDRLVLDL